MKKVININFQGRVVPIEETAYDILKQYVDSLRRYFATEEGRDEIINDIESRIAELFAEILKKGSTCIVDADVQSIIASMGRPEDFEGEEDNVRAQLGAEQQSTYQQNFEQHQTSSNEPRRLYRDENHKFLGGVCSGIANYLGTDPIIVRLITLFTIGVTFIPYIILWVAIPSSATQVIGSMRKRLFRDAETKIIGGVSGGLASYFGVNIWIPRALFLIPFFSIVFHWSHWGVFDMPNFLNLSFSPGATVVYIILWLILPEAITSADKLEMKGERVDLNSIKNTIQTDMEGFKGRAEKLGEELRGKAQQFGQEFGAKGNQFGNEAGYAARRAGRGLGDFIALIAKIFAYFILAVVLFSIVAVLFSFGVIGIGFLPAKDYILTDGWQNAFAWGTLILFIWVPVIGIITWIIRRITRSKSNSSIMRYSFTALWILGWFCMIGLLNSLKNEIKYHNNAIEENVFLSNPKVKKLEIKAGNFAKFYGTGNWFKIEPFASFDGDTVFVRNVHIRVIKAASDSFVVTMARLSNGSTKAHAGNLANRINYSITQKDTSLLLDKGIGINITDKFRNQRIVLTIAVPVGKHILIKENAGWSDNVHMNFNNDNDWSWRRDYDDEDNDWDHDVEYVMTSNGLERVDKKPIRKNDNDDENNTLEEFKRNREELKKDLEQKQKDLEQQQKDLEQQRKELQQPLDSGGKYHYQKTVATPKLRQSTINWCTMPNRLNCMEAAG